LGTPFLNFHWLKKGMRMLARKVSASGPAPKKGAVRHRDEKRTRGKGEKGGRIRREVRKFLPVMTQIATKRREGGTAGKDKGPLMGGNRLQNRGGEGAFATFCPQGRFEENRGGQE